MTKTEIKEKIANENVKFIRLQFTDIFGMMKCITIASQQLDQILEKGRMFDGSSIEGFARLEESDMVLIPDLDTFTVLPFSEKPAKIARLICDVYSTDGKPSKCDPRFVLKKAIEHAGKLGYTVNIGPELEFFLFGTDAEGRPILNTTDNCGYFEVAPVDYGAICRNEICLALEKMGFTVEASHHENGKAQHEIDFKYCEALDAADKIMTFKLAAKSIAQENNLYASFMPKPLFGSAGNGMHINISLSKNGKNVMWGSNEGNLSDTALQFIGGLLKHAPAFCAVTNPLVNSYKRLVSGFEAPTTIAWSVQDRSPLIRIPSFNAENARIELRSPDPACNPYLAFAAIIEAGLDGIENAIKPEKCGVSQGELPEDLISAVNELENDSCIKNALGDEISPIYINSKKNEWASYRTMVTSWELDKYLTRY